MSDRTTLSVYLDGSPVDVTIYPYYDDVASDRTFLCKVICLASLLDDCTDVKEIKKRCHINRGYTPEEADIYSVEEQDEVEHADSERIGDSHYVIDLTARCIYHADFPSDFGNLSIPLDILKTRPRAIPQTLHFLDNKVLWLDDINTNLIRQILAEQSN